MTAKRAGPKGPKRESPVGRARKAKALAVDQVLADANSEGPTASPAQAGSQPARGGLRARKSAQRRQAILEAALDEFSKEGFAATRLEDVAQRAGVAKGTIYLHFRDKQELFLDLIRSMMAPQLDALEALRELNAPAPAVIRAFAELFVREVLGTRRRDVIRLVIAEGPRFPAIAEFYYREVVSRGIAVLTHVLRRGVERGEIAHRELAEFPQLVFAPAVLAITWRSLFELFAPLDGDKMLEAHLKILFGPAGEP